MANSDTPPTRLRLAAARRRDPIPFDLAPDPEIRAALADELGLSSLKKLRFRGTLEPQDRGDWRLEAALGATVVQPCDITLEPVTTRIDEPVRRRYVGALGQVELPPEQEIPENVDEEPLPETLDLEAVMVEALSLAIPAFPRSESAVLGEAVYTEPGTEPLRDQDTKPFAGLKDALKSSD